MISSAQLGPKLAPFTPSGNVVLDHALDLLALSRDDVLFDLGCGDARILVHAAVKTGTRCIGVEYDSNLVKRAWARVKEHAVESLVDIHYGDALEVDLTQATALFLYLMPQGIKMLLPKCDLLRACCCNFMHLRIGYCDLGWKVDDQRNYKGTKLYSYNSPAAVAQCD